MVKKHSIFCLEKGANVNAKKPDLILLDSKIPIFNGHEVLQKFKADSKLKKIPVIMLTKSSNQKDLPEAYENHCNSYVKKPFERTSF